MAEKSIRIADDASGDRMATRDAFELDGSNNARVIERVDFAGGKCPNPIGPPIRGGEATIPFNSGGTYEVLIGDLIEGATTGATAIVVEIEIDDGWWNNGDCEGHFHIVQRVGRLTGGFCTPEDINVGANNNVATLTDCPTNVDLTAADSLNLSGISSARDLMFNMIDVGDKTTLFVAIEEETQDGTVTITPILYDDTYDADYTYVPGIVGILESKTFTPAHDFYYSWDANKSDENMYLSAIQSWNVSGAYKIALHVTAITGTSNVVKVYGWVI